MKAQIYSEVCLYTKILPLLVYPFIQRHFPLSVKNKKLQWNVDYMEACLLFFAFRPLPPRKMDVI